MSASEPDLKPKERRKGADWLMLLLEWRRRRFGAVVGQGIRMLLGAVGSALGKVPTGNTGDSDISMFQSLPIDPELQQIIDGKTADSSHGSAQHHSTSGSQKDSSV